MDGRTVTGGEEGGVRRVREDVVMKGGVSYQDPSGGSPAALDESSPTRNHRGN